VASMVLLSGLVLLAVSFGTAWWQTSVPAAPSGPVINSLYFNLGGIACSWGSNNCPIYAPSLGALYGGVGAMAIIAFLLGVTAAVFLLLGAYG